MQYLLQIILALVIASSCASNSDSPRAKTVPVIDSPVFPYAHPQEVGLSIEELGRLGDEITSWVDSGELVGAELLIVKRGKAIFHEVYGWSNREIGQPLRRNSLFPIKSMSKPITATAILMLADDGELSLDDPVDYYVANFPHDDITVGHLLSHTSGIEYDFDSYDFFSPEASLEDLVENWSHTESVSEIGRFSYNDYNFATLAYIVGVVSQEPVHTFIRNRIFGPLAMSNSSAKYLADREWQDNLNPWYIWNADTRGYELRWPSHNTKWPDFYAGGWGVFSTAMDYASFMAMWMGGGALADLRLLSVDRVRTALAPKVGGDDIVFYGYGWQVRMNANGVVRRFFHGGGNDSVGIVFPAEELLVVYLTQSRLGPHLDSFIDRLFNSKLFDHPGLSVGIE